MQYRACLPLISEIDSETGGSVTYKANSGKAVGKLVTVKVTPNRESVTEYGDDGVAEQVSYFKDADVELGATFIPRGCETVMFGVTATTKTEGTGNDTVTIPVLTDKEDDDGQYTGFGFVWAEMQNGEKVFRLQWLYKVKWEQPSNEFETKGASVSFKKPTIKGKAIPRGDGEWRFREDYATAAAAIAALKALAQFPSA